MFYRAVVDFDVIIRINYNTQFQQYWLTWNKSGWPYMQMDPTKNSKTFDANEDWK